jgi:molybdopterin-containing oxidoreductase family iron-sulfur binding subunit
MHGPTGDDTYNLIPFLSNSLADGSLAHLPWLQAAPDPVTTVVWHTWVEINSKTAEEKGIHEGDMIEITSPNGKVEAPAYVHPAVPPWTVSMPIGQGHTAFGRYAEGVGVNTLSILAPLTDGETRALAWAATRVSIRKTGKRIDMPRFEGNVPAIEADEGRIIPITLPD